MKRKGNIYSSIYSIENLKLADSNARKGKLKQPGVIEHDKNREAAIKTLHDMLKNKTYTTSAYKIFTINEPKERQIFRLPYFPDRIAQHAVMNQLEQLFVNCFTSNTYSCIKGKGIHGATFALRKSLQDKGNAEFYVQMDIRKFYSSIDHGILKALLRKKIKDKDLLWLLDEIIDSADGLPIGNYLSQYFANFYLTYFDRWLKEQKKVKHYFRYADDLIILSGSKSYLHKLRAEIMDYLLKELNLTLKDNYRVSPIYPHGINFVGYVHFPTHTLLRPEIKKDFARCMTKDNFKLSARSRYGWAKHCNSVNLLRKLKYYERVQEHGHRAT